MAPIQSSPAKKSTKKSKTPKIPEEGFPLVAIGASAGGLEALGQFFKPIPLENNMAYIVITHLDPEHKSLMPELIAQHTQMPVFAIKNGMTILPNTVYVIPPNKNASIKANTLSLVPQDEPHYTNLPINFFFRALAMAQGEHAVAVILSGFGTDGSLGIRDIKQQGGIIVVQDPQTTEYDSMPRSGINTGLVDCVAPADKIYENISKLLKIHRVRIQNVSIELQQIFTILRAKTGHDFSGYKLSVLNRRIDRQMQRLHIIDLGDYVRYLRLNLQEVDHLFTDLLISVTCFFRDSDAFNDLKLVVLPKLLKNKPKDYIFRAWVPGCATGEEAYSLAMLLREYMIETQRYFHVQIFGTDIDIAALDTARACIYPETISQEVSQERLDRFFIKDKSQYKVKKEVREMIIFGVQNITQEPPFTKLDLISCRNLLIYLSIESQRKLYPIFHFSLKPKGVLFLGMSESATQYDDLFVPLVKKWKFFERKEVLMSPALAFINRQVRHTMHELIAFDPEKDVVPIPKSELNIAIRTQIIEKFTPSCMIVNSHDKVIFSHGDLDDYLLAGVKLLHADIFNIVHPDIKTILVPALYRVAHEKINLQFDKVKVRTPLKTVLINIKIDLVKDSRTLNGAVLICFGKQGDPSSEKIKLDKAKKVDKKLLEVEQELQFTKENLQATIEELETSNEEMQSTNEELQSINEELETSKEELQSVNEELVIVNTELQNRVEQIAAVNDDMNNLFNSTDIAAFFLDNALLIKRYTPKAQELIHLIPADIGRSFKHFATNIKNVNLVEQAEDVIKTLAHKSIEVQTNNEQWYLVHILPYRTLANMIDGVVITFTDITQNKLAEKTLSKLNNDLHDALSFSENILDTVREPLVVLDSELHIVTANRSFYNKFILKQEEIVGKFFYEVGDKQWNFPNLRKLLDQVVKENLVFEGCEIEHTFPRLGHKKLLLNARKIIRHKTGKDMILLAIEHISG